MVEPVESALRLGLVAPDWTFFFQIVNTLILFALLKHFLFEPVTKFMEDRENEIKDNIKDAEVQKEDAYSLKAEYEGKLQKAGDEGKEIIKEHTRKAEKRAFEIVKTAEGEIDSMKINAHKELEREQLKAVNELKNQISELTIMAASQVIEKDLDESSHKDLIDKFIGEVGDTEWLN